MGHLQAAEMAEMTDLRQGLTWHLRGNHYPPVPTSMVDACIDAMYAYAEGDPQRQITLPEGITFKGSPTAPALEIIEQHHLWDFTATIVDGGFDE